MTNSTDTPKRYLRTQEFLIESYGAQPWFLGSKIVSDGWAGTELHLSFQGKEFPSSFDYVSETAVIVRAALSEKPGRLYRVGVLSLTDAEIRAASADLAQKFGACRWFSHVQVLTPKKRRVELHLTSSTKNVPPEIQGFEIVGAPFYLNLTGNKRKPQVLVIGG